MKERERERERERGVRAGGEKEGERDSSWNKTKMMYVTGTHTNVYVK